MRTVAALLVAFTWSCALASDPGQPLDCSDWVIHLSGITCTTIQPYPCSAEFSCDVRGANVDNNGNGVVFRRGPTGVVCAGCAQLATYDLLLAPQQGDPIVVASLSERCSPGDADFIGTFGVRFDAVRGRMLVGYTNFSCGAYPFFSQVIAFDGFASLFEVLQSYTPQASLGFRVPYMPEGMAAADHFDTYWGSLVHPIDFTQAHPLQCGYPAAPPQVGDYLTVADTVPTPGPGQGVYYVTSATYQGATRYGRKASNGHLSGRDPALLPVCGAE
jgi:hypothetical protein